MVEVCYTLDFAKNRVPTSFMLLFLSNGNSNETGAFSPFLQKSQKSSIYGAFRTFYILPVLDIADFLEKYFPLSSYMFSYLSKCFNRSKSVCLNGHVSSNLTACAKKGHILCPFIFSYDEARLFFDYCDAKNECRSTRLFFKIFACTRHSAIS